MVNERNEVFSGDWTCQRGIIRLIAHEYLIAMFLTANKNTAISIMLYTSTSLHQEQH
jgi:hypothetical protein